MFYGARCNGQLALANRGFKIAPDATSTGYIFLVLAAVASAASVLPRFVDYCSCVASSYQIDNTPDAVGCV